MQFSPSKLMTSDNPKHLDPAMTEALRLCISEDRHYYSVTLSLSLDFSPTSDQRALSESLEWYVERLSRLDRRRKRERWLQALFVRESPERMTSEGRKRSGTFHNHIHGMIEAPTTMSGYKFAYLATGLWEKTPFPARCNTDIWDATYPAGWLEYISKRGSRDPKTNFSTFNELLYESFRPITPAATVSLPSVLKNLTG